MSVREYPVTVVRVIDGDTVLVDLDLGFWMTARLSCRLAACNAIESNQPGGSEAHTHLAALLPVGTVTTTRSIGVDKYSGRFDGYLALPDGRDATAVMIADGYAAPWNGKGKRPTPPWPIPVPVSKEGK
jgi:endonuclease YncB( thermonuclease family)